MAEIDIVVPVYNEAENILGLLDSLKDKVKTPLRVLICYDHDNDTTLACANWLSKFPFEVLFIKNRVQPGPHGATVSGFHTSTADAVLVIPADDHFNAGIIEKMVEKMRAGNVIVCASRFIPGGCMEGCPWLKYVLVRLSSFFLRRVAFLPVHDASNGFRLFTRKVIDQIELESSVGFTYSIEYLVKAHRLGWPIDEVPAKWFQRKAGESRFRVLKWLFPYLRWFLYAFETTYLRKKKVTMKAGKLPRSASLSLDTRP